MTRKEKKNVQKRRTARMIYNKETIQMVRQKV